MGRSLVSKSGNDCFQTPVYLADLMVRHFKPTGTILEPCKGDGNFLKVLPNADWCEIKEDKDFLVVDGHWDWIITNPPYSKFKEFLKKSMEVADNVVFLIPLVHIWTKARLKIMWKNNFAIKEIFCVNTPKEFPQFGFQMGCVYYKRGYRGETIIQKEGGY